MKAQILLFAVLVHSVAGQFCDLCGGKGSPANSNLVIPLIAIGENQNPTCQQLFEFANTAISPNDEVCSLIKSHKDFCGCPDAATAPLNSCSLCPEGATPLNLNADTPYEDSCSELDAYLRYLPADICLTDRVSEIMKADFFCGCPGATSDCTMCNDGTNNLANPDRKVPFYEFLGGRFTATCQELADRYTLFDTEDPNFGLCEYSQLQSRYCGCQSEPDTSPVNACKICSDGSAPMKGDKFIPELKMTCAELEFFMNHIPSDQCDKDWFKDLNRFDYFCGCENASATCAICPDGSIDISNPDAVIPYLIIPYNQNPTCQELATLGVIADAGELVLEDCSLFEAQASFCGCPGTTKPESTCDFCPGGDSPANENLATPFGDTCKELSEYLSYMTPDECDSQRVGFIKRQDFLCGCPSATTTCALCADHGSNDVRYSDRRIPLLSLPLNPNPTCGEMVEFIAVNDGDLSDSTCSALQEYQGYCGCPATPVRNECAFCPRGGTISTPDKVVSDVFTCQDLQDFVSFLTLDQCVEDDRDFEQIQAFAYVCGCPNVEPSCTLCPSGKNPPSGSTLIGDNTGITCDEYAEVVETFTESTCAAQRDEIQGYASACGCGSPVAPPTTTPGIADNDDFSPQSPDELEEELDDDFSPQSSAGSEDAFATVIVVASIVPVVLALLVLVYYFYCKTKQYDSKTMVDPEGTEDQLSPLPVEKMEGSLSMSDIPIGTPRSPPPPAESFSIDDDDDEEDDANETSEVADEEEDEHKIV